MYANSTALNGAVSGAVAGAASSNPGSHIKMRAMSLDVRASATDRVVYETLYKFRFHQLLSGVDLSQLTDEQWGLVRLDKCHHISTTSVNRDASPSFRVRICKTCCQENGHVELGTYVDQESAILVNDAYEIMSSRFDRLIVLVPQDKPFLHLLTAKKHDRVKGRDYLINILQLITDRMENQEGKRGRSYMTYADNMGTLSSPTMGGSTEDSSSHEDKSDGIEDEDPRPLTPPVMTNRSFLPRNMSETDIDSASSSEIKLGFRPHEFPPVSPIRADNLDYYDPSALLVSLHSKKLTAEDSLQSPRQRSATFAASYSDCSYMPYFGRVSDPTSYGAMPAFETPMNTLSLIASMEDDEVDVARSLFQLSSMKGDIGEYGQESLSPKEEDTSMYEYQLDMLPNYKGRGRSNSMLVLDKKSNLILARNNGTSTRAKDPLSMALKKLHDKGGGTNVHSSHNPDGFIGIYSREERKLRLQRFFEKRKLRMWTKKVKYDVRKNFADSRVRVKGRFVKKDEEQVAQCLLGVKVNNGGSNDDSILSTSSAGGADLSYPTIENIDISDRHDEDMDV